jgi:hypothetical protein
MISAPRRLELEQAIQFLRDHGDTVEPAAGGARGGFTVNGAVTLTPEEVIARAKRLSAGGGPPPRKPPTR